MSAPLFLTKAKQKKEMKCKTCGGEIAHHNDFEFARCLLRAEQRAARAMYCAAEGLLCGTTREQYELQCAKIARLAALAANLAPRLSTCKSLLRESLEWE